MTFFLFSSWEPGLLISGQKAHWQIWNISLYKVGVIMCGKNSTFNGTEIAVISWIIVRFLWSFLSFPCESQGYQDLTKTRTSGRYKISHCTPTNKTLFYIYSCKFVSYKIRAKIGLHTWIHSACFKIFISQQKFLKFGTVILDYIINKLMFFVFWNFGQC